MITLTSLAKQCNKGYEPINWAVVMLGTVITWDITCTCIVAYEGNDNNNMVFSSICQAQFALYMEENSTSKYNINMVKNMLILKRRYKDYRHVRFSYLMSFLQYLRKLQSLILYFYQLKYNISGWITTEKYNNDFPWQTQCDTFYDYIQHFLIFHNHKSKTVMC